MAKNRINVISSSYGNDSLALIQWALENQLSDVTVVFIDTGWSAPGWLERVARCEEWVRSIGFTTVNVKPDVQFEELMRIKKGFPSQQFQWCSSRSSRIRLPPAYGRSADPGLAKLAFGDRGHRPPAGRGFLRSRVD